MYGWQLAAVAWIESRVRDPRKRAVLFNLATASRELSSDDPARLHLERARAQLLRMWVE